MVASDPDLRLTADEALSRLTSVVHSMAPLSLLIPPTVSDKVRPDYTSNDFKRVVSMDEIYERFLLRVNKNKSSTD